MKKLGELGFTIVPSGHSRSAETALLHERKKTRRTPLGVFRACASPGCRARGNSPKSARSRAPFREASSTPLAEMEQGSSVVARALRPPDPCGTGGHAGRALNECYEARPKSLCLGGAHTNTELQAPASERI